MKQKIVSLLLVVFLSVSVAGVAIGNTDSGTIPEKEISVSEESTDVPVLSIGDTWTYRSNVTAELDAVGTMYIEENLTYTVDSIETYTYNETEHYGYNLTMEGELVYAEIEGDNFDVEVHSSEMEGYSFLRMSDLGVVADYEWRWTEGTLNVTGIIDEEFPANLTLETLSHDDPTVEEYDFPIELGGEFSFDTTERSRSYTKFDAEGLEDLETTTYPNVTRAREVLTSQSREDISVPAGEFSTFEQEESSMEEDHTWTRYYSPEVKRYVRLESQPPGDAAETTEELLEYDVAERPESLSISPSSGRPGDEVTISGSFPEHPNEDIRIWIPEAEEEYSVTTDSEGDFDLDIEVPHASDRTDAPGELGSIGVIAELQDDPKEAYAVSTLVVEGVADIEIVSPEEGHLSFESNVTVEWESEFTDYHEIRVNEEDWEDVGEATSHTFEFDDGEYMIEVKAVEELDDGGTYSQTDEVNITVDATPPEIDIVSPEDGEILTEDEVTIEWTGEGGMVEIESYMIRIAGGDWIELEDPLDTSYTFTNLDDREYTVDVRGRDEEGRNGTESVNFQVETEPRLIAHSFSVMPNRGSTPLDVNITAEVENGGHVDREVEISALGEDIHEETVPGQEKIEIDISHTFEEVGDIEVVLQDEEGNELYSETVEVTDVFDLTINIDGEGSTNPSEGVYTYDEGEEVTIRATAADGWYFDGWTGDHDSMSEEITLTMDDDMEITANFMIFEYDLTINIEGEGSTDPSEGTHTFEHGEEVTINATADEGWNFEEWTGDYEESMSEEITITMEDDVDVTVIFEEDEDEDTPGFTLPIVILSACIALILYYKKKR